jgi:hypothetical protein
MKEHETWAGKRRELYGEVFIETSHKDWGHRLFVWRKLHSTDPQCPCPMVKGHIMFKS